MDSKHCIETCLLVLLGFSAPTAAQQSQVAEEPVAITAMTKEIRISPDGRSTQIIHVEMRAGNEAAATQIGTANFTFDTTMDELDVVEAHTLKANGNTIPVGSGAIYDQLPAGLPTQWITSLRSKVIVFPQFSAGDTAVYTIRLSNREPLFKGQFFYGDIFPRTSAYGDVRETITAPKSLPLHTESHDVNFSQREMGSNIVYSWHYSAPSAPGEVFKLSELERTPRFFISSFSDYAQLGKSYGALTGEKRTVTRKIAALADEITAGTSDRKIQAQKLYEWVSTHIRYVAIELGTGSIIPHDVDSIIANGYGDCKDHDLLLESLLKAKGIESESILINGDDSYAVTEVPTLTALNHVITFVPEFGLYLDSTATVAPFGVLPLQEYGKPMIIASSSDAGLGKMPLLRPGIAKIVTKTVEALDKQGHLTGTTVTTAAGPYAINLRALGLAIQAAGPRAASTLLAARGYADGEGSFTQDSPIAQTPTHTITGTFRASGWSEYLSGSKSFVLPGGLRVLGLTGDGIMGAFYPNKSDSNEPSLCYSAEAAEDISLKAPPGLHFNNAPADTKVMTPNLSFTARWTLSDDTISVHREFQSQIDTQFCVGDVRTQTAAALKKIAQSYDENISFQEQGPAGDAYRQATKFYEAGQYREAVEAYSKLIAIEPNQATSYYDRALAYAQSNQTDKAVEDFTKAIQLESDNADYYSKRGNAYGQLGQQAKSLADFDKAISLDAENADYYYRRGRIYYSLRQLDNSLKDFNKATALDPNFPNPYHDRAVVYLSQGHFDLAIAEFDHAIKLDPTQFIFFVDRGAAYAQKKQYDLAIADENMAIKLKPDDFEPYYSQAGIYFEMSRYADAIKDYDKAIALNPKLANAFLYRGGAKNKLGQTAEGNRDIAQAVKLDPQLAK